MAKKSKESSGRSVASAMLAIEHTNQRGVHGLLDDCIAASRKMAQEKQLFDGQVLSADETLAQLICLPMPALAPRFLLQNEGWPLGRFVLVDGFQESCKSAFLNEVGTWHRQPGGHYIVIETEEKDGSDLRDSFFNYDRSAWHFTRARSQEDWNRAFFWWMDQLHKMMDGYERELTDEEIAKEMKKRAKESLDDGEAIKQKKAYGKPEKAIKKKVKMPGRGRIAPICLGVDSLSAVLIERLVDEMEKEGAPELNHPLGARLLSDFFKVGPKQLSRYPISFMAVSHLREGQVQGMAHLKTRNTTGGMAPKFQMTTEIEMKRRKQGQIVRTHKVYGEVYSIDLSMHVRKNSLAGHEFLNVEMVWYYDPTDLNPLTGEKRQKTYFDWHSASIELLIDCSKAGDAGKGFSGGRAKELRALVDIHKDEDRRQVWSNELGISSDDRLSYHEAGQVLEHKIQNDGEFRKQLYELLGIRQRRMFQSGVDMRAQIDSHYADLIAAEATTLDTLSSQAASEMPLPVDAEVACDEPE